MMDVPSSYAANAMFDVPLQIQRDRASANGTHLSAGGTIMLTSTFAQRKARKRERQNKKKSRRR